MAGPDGNYFLWCQYRYTQVTMWPTSPFLWYRLNLTPKKYPSMLRVYP